MDYFKDLVKVVTISEAAQIYGLSKQTVYRWCLEGKVTATQSGGVWLISLRHLIDLRGIPPHVENSLDTITLSA